MKLWYFRNRRYLTGIDWVVGSLHEAAKKVNGCGAISQAVLELNGRLEEEPVRKALDQISARFPILSGCFGRDWFNLAPYWKVPGAAQLGKIELRVVELGEDASDEADRLLTEHVNTPLASDRQHLRFLLIRLGNRQTRLGLLFDHRLFDAFGAETFFRLLEETWAGNLEAVAPKIRITEPAHLDHWGRRFASGQTLNRVMLEMQKKDVCALKMPAKSSKICFVHSPLTVEETAAINRLAFSEISVPILLPSAAARAVEAVREGIGSTALAGSQYLMFTSANMRTAGQEWESIFFNHFSFVLFSEPAEKRGRKEIAIGLRDQFFAAMKQKLPFALQDAAMLGRIFPRWLVARVTNSLFGGRMCSFYFACLKDCGFASATFMGLPVENLIHTPLAFSPPGMNLCMTFYGGHFNLVFSYLDGVMERETAEGILLGFKDLLVGKIE